MKEQPKPGDLIEAVDRPELGLRLILHVRQYLSGFHICRPELIITFLTYDPPEYRISKRTVHHQSPEEFWKIYKKVS